VAPALAAPLSGEAVPPALSAALRRLEPAVLPVLVALLRQVGSQ
jgi:hypothetical protein